MNSSAPRGSASRSVLFWLLALSSPWEMAIMLSLFFYPQFEAKQFGVEVSDQLVYFDRIIGSFLVLFSALCVWGAWLVRARSREGRVLSFMIGAFWVLIGFVLYFHPGTPPYVLLDVVRGALIVVLSLVMDRELA